jgi:hypothetical protein
MNDAEARIPFFASRKVYPRNLHPNPPAAKVLIAFLSTIRMAKEKPKSCSLTRMFGVAVLAKLC